MPNPPKLEKQVTQWNLSHRSGTPVTRYKLIDPLREGDETQTGSEAWIVDGYSALVMVAGVAGGVCLESVIPSPQDVKGLPRR